MIKTIWLTFFDLRTQTNNWAVYHLSAFLEQRFRQLYFGR